MHAALALLASAVWGTSDFLGGTLARRLPALRVVALSQLVALVALVPVAAAFGGGSGLGYLPWAVAAGAVGTIALRAFYEGLATGTMGVVAPIAALGVIVPVVIGASTGGTPSVLQLAGIAVAVTGVVAASGPEVRGRVGRRPVALAGLAAVGFGLVIYLIARGSRVSIVMTLLAMRATTVLPLLGWLLVQHLAHHAGGPAGSGGSGSSGRRWPAWPRRRAGRLVAGLAAAGLLDLGANAAYGVAVTGGLLAVVAVLSSLYPVGTVLLARAVHGERLRPVQLAGVASALAGVALIAAGGGAG